MDKPTTKSSTVQEYEALSVQVKQQVKDAINDYLTLPEVSQVKLANMFADIFGHPFAKRSTKTLLLWLDTPEKQKDLQSQSKGMINQVKRVGNQENFIDELVKDLQAQNHTINEFKDDWKTNGVGFFRNKYGFSQYQTERLVDYLGIQENHVTKMTKTWKQVILDLSNKNITKDVVYDYVFQQNHTIKETEEFISQTIGWDIGSRRFEKIREYWNFPKTR